MKSHYFALLLFCSPVLYLFVVLIRVRMYISSPIFSHFGVSLRRYTYQGMLEWDDSVVPAKLKHLEWQDSFTVDLA